MIPPVSASLCTPPLASNISGGGGGAMSRLQMRRLRADLQLILDLFPVHLWRRVRCVRYSNIEEGFVHPPPFKSPSEIPGNVDPSSKLGRSSLKLRG